MQRQTCLEQEIKNLSSLVGKLSSSIEDNVVERTARQMSSSPVTGYTPGYKSPPRYMPQYHSQSPVQTYNSGRSAPQSVNLRPEWYSPNGRQQFSPNRGGYQSPNFRDQGRGQGQYQGQNKGFTPSPRTSIQRQSTESVSSTINFQSESEINIPTQCCKGTKQLHDSNVSQKRTFKREGIRADGQHLVQNEGGQLNQNYDAEGAKQEGLQSDKLPELSKIIDKEEPEILVYRQTSGHSLLIPL